MSDEFRCGTMDGTGATITIELGWVPDYVIVQNFEASDFARLQWFKGMANGAAIKTVTSTNSKISTLGITPFQGSGEDPDAIKRKGFLIGADTDVNVNGEALSWVAFRNTP